MGRPATGRPAAAIMVGQNKAAKMKRTLFNRGIFRSCKKKVSTDLLTADCVVLCTVCTSAALRALISNFDGKHACVRACVRGACQA